MSFDAPLSTSRHPTLRSRVREELREQILSGTRLPHDRMPSESEPMAQYGVSRITVRQALGDLESAQRIFKVPGKGSFVASSKPFQDLGRLQGFAEAMGGMDPRSSPVDCEHLYCRSDSSQYRLRLQRR